VLGALHYFEGTAGNLSHITQHQDADVSQAVMVPVVDRPLVPQFTDVDLRAVGVAEVGIDRFTGQLFEESQMNRAGHHVANEGRSVPEASDSPLVAPRLWALSFGVHLSEANLAHDFNGFRCEEAERGSESQL